jgi:hypothetical protein
LKSGGYKISEKSKSTSKKGQILRAGGDALVCEIVLGLGNGDFLMSGSKFLQELSS